ncbi:SpvB/TcaC N-terminal domain-containing protein [Phytohabitans flavus]
MPRPHRPAPVAPARVVRTGRRPAQGRRCDPGIGERFQVNPARGTGAMTVPVAVSPGRAGFGPSLALSYDSGHGNGTYGLGWALSMPAVSRRTDRGVPRYDDTDVFTLGGEDLIPELDPDDDWRPVVMEEPGHLVTRYRPRVDAAFARIERWVDKVDGTTHWRTTGGDNVTTVYGATAAARIADPADPRRVLTWLVCSTFDDRGNVVVFDHKPEDRAGVDTGHTAERHRTPAGTAANRYLKRIRYGNRVSRLVDPDLTDPLWMFEVVLDYGDHDPDLPTPAEDRPWASRPDPFSSYRAGFELRTYRLCRRVLMFHHFPGEAEVGAGCLVASTDLTYAPDPTATLLTAITHSRYRRTGTGYRKRSLPPAEFGYQPADPHDAVADLDADGGVCPPACPVRASTSSTSTERHWPGPSPHRPAPGTTSATSATAGSPPPSPSPPFPPAGHWAPGRCCSTSTVTARSTSLTSAARRPGSTSAPTTGSGPRSRPSPSCPLWTSTTRTRGWSISTVTAAPTCC